MSIDDFVPPDCAPNLSGRSGRSEDVRFRPFFLRGWPIGCARGILYPCQNSVVATWLYKTSELCTRGLRSEFSAHLWTRACVLRGSCRVRGAVISNSTGYPRDARRFETMKHDEGGYAEIPVL